jgi:hypothetical protein
MSLVYGWPVDEFSDGSVTLRQHGAEGDSKDVFPVLLLIGSAEKGGALDLPRVVRLPPRTLEIGRLRGEPAEEREGRLGVPDKLLSRVHLHLERVPGGCDVVSRGGSGSRTETCCSSEVTAPCSAL